MKLCCRGFLLPVGDNHAYQAKLQPTTTTGDITMKSIIVSTQNLWNRCCLPDLLLKISGSRKLILPHVHTSTWCCCHCAGNEKKSTVQCQTAQPEKLWSEWLKNLWKGNSISRLNNECWGSLRVRSSAHWQAFLLIVLKWRFKYELHSLMYWINGSAVPIFLHYEPLTEPVIKTYTPFEIWSVET